MSPIGRRSIHDATVRGIALLGSLRLAIFLLVLITMAAIIGGILPQTPLTPNANEVYRSYGAFWYRLITRLSLDDIFHSAWFSVLVGLFALNLVLCTGRRARRSVARVLRRPTYAAISAGDNAVLKITMPGTIDREAVLREALHRAGLGRIARVVPADHRTDMAQLVGRHRQWGALAPDLIHIAILVILLGALLGALRQDGTFIVNEWEKGLRLPACAKSGMHDTSIACIPVAYDLRVDDFGVETYEGSSRVKTYWAELSFLQGNDLVRQGRVSVNHPMTVGGFGFYPWRYGDDVGATFVRLHVLEQAHNAVTSEIELRVGETVIVPGTQLWLTAVRFYRTFALTDEGEPVDLGNVPGGHSAVLLQIMGLDEAGTTVAYRDLALPFVPESDVDVSYVFLLADAQIPIYLEIHYARNPGYPVVWWGFVLLMVGLAGAFYFAPAEIRVSMGSGHVLLRPAGRGSTKRLNEIATAIRRYSHGKEA